MPRDQDNDCFDTHQSQIDFAAVSHSESLPAGAIRIHIAGRIPKDVIARIQAANPSVESERFNDEIK